MKSRTVRALLSGSVAAVMALGISIPSQAEAAPAQVTVKSGMSYEQLIQYLQQYYGGQTGFGTITGGNTSTTKPTPTKPETVAPEAEPATPEAAPVPSEPAAPAEKPAAPAPVTPSEPATDRDSTAVEESGSSAYVKEIVTLVNEERAKAGLSPLTALDSLNKVAAAKATDMRTNNYFSHTSPTYGSPFDMMSAFGVTYSYAGENIAKGQRTPQEVMTAWMNSPGHKANILGENFNYIGIGFDNNYWVQMFIGK